MANQVQFLGSDENFVYAAFINQEDDQKGLPQICVFDTKAWFEQDPHVSKGPIKVFKPSALKEGTDHAHFSEGIATGFLSPTSSEMRVPSIAFGYDAQCPEDFSISYLDTDEKTQDKTKPEFIFNQLCFKQALVKDKTFEKTEQSVFNLAEETIKALKHDMRFKDAKLIKSVGDELFEIQTALSHNEAKFIIAAFHAKIELVICIDLNDFRLQVFTSSQINPTIPNARFSRELPYFVETSAEEIIFLEPTPFEYNIETSTFNYLCYYYKFGDSAKRVRPDLSATFIKIKYNHPNSFPFRLLTICNSYGIDIIAYDLISLQAPVDNNVPPQDTWASFFVMGLQDSIETSSEPLINKSLIFVREQQFVIAIKDDKPVLKPFTQ